MSPISETVLAVCQEHGMQFKRNGSELYASCPFHTDGKRPNFRVNPEKNSWFCDVCATGGGVVEFLALKQNRPKKDVFKELVRQDQPPPQSSRIVATYDYHDQLGNLVYQVCRMDPKSFRQRRPDGRGGWVWSMEGVERVLYRLPAVLNPKNRFVWIVEGEKDVETLKSIQMCATTNVGGAGKWHDGYSECLRDKDVVLCGDNDEPGRKHMAKIMESLSELATSVRRIELPESVKDISDYAERFQERTEFAAELAKLVDSAPVMMRGGLLPIKSIAEQEQEYIEHVRDSRTRTVDLSRWIPSLSCVRSLVSGEVVAIIGDTGTAKTYVLQHIALHCRVPTLLFELELPDSLTFERFVQIANGVSGAAVFGKYNAGERISHSSLSHVYTCTKARLTPNEIESLILKSELKMGVRPTLVLVDYIQLIQGLGKRYERISDAAEQIKVIAKSTKTTIIVASQVHRDMDAIEPGLHDAKDSGSIENSSGVVIVIWRDNDDASVINLKVVKNTKGRPTQPIRCRIRGDSMQIVEESKISEEDIPR